MTEMETQIGLSNIIVEIETSDDKIENNENETKENKNEENEYEYNINETSELSPKNSPKAPQSPKTPAPKPPSFPSTYSIENIDITTTNNEPKTPPLNRRETPKAIAPKPPSTYPQTHSGEQLIDINEEDPFRQPAFHDYTSLACCLIFFFFFTGLSIVAYCKAKAAVEAYRNEEYAKYKTLNRQARSYMIIAVALSMAFLLIALLVIIFIGSDESPNDTIPEK